MRIVGVDPGGTTGLVVVEPPARLLTYQEERDLDAVLAWLTKQQPQEVVSESFRLYPGRSRAQSWGRLPSPQVIGAVQAWCSTAGVPFVLQAAAQRVRITNGILRAIGAFVPGRPHVVDAARHAFFRLWFAHGWHRDDTVRQAFVADLRAKEQALTPLDKAEVLQRARELAARIKSRRGVVP